MTIRREKPVMNQFAPPFRYSSLRPGPVVDPLSIRLDCLEREVHDLRQRQLAVRLRRGWRTLRVLLWGEA